MRDDFRASVKEIVAKRTGFRCSNPTCRAPTIGPNAKGGSASIGVAAHITAASPKGPRYDRALDASARSNEDNAIWLCQSCSRLIDADAEGYPAHLLRDWKVISEATAALELRGFAVKMRRSFEELESKFPELIAEMRTDHSEHPFVREFILMKRGWIYSGDPNNPVFSYYFEDHEHLIAKLKVMVNYGAVVETTYNNTERFEFTEAFVEYLIADNG